MSRERFIEESWDDLDSVLEGLREGLNDEETLESVYDMDATELVNYVSENFVTDEHDIERVRDVFENGKCPECVEDNRGKALSGDVDSQRVDPTLEHYVWTDQEEGYREDKGDMMNAYLAVKCGNGHDDAFMIYEESWYMEE